MCTKVLKNNSSHSICNILTVFLWLITISFILGSFIVSDIDAKLLTADKIVVKKSKRIMTLFNKGRILKQYKIALGKQPVGKKMFAGDKRTPEGSYIIDSRKADSKYYLALHISYPNHVDLENSEKLGLNPGGDIMIHGLPNGYEDVEEFHRITDWTDGCIAVTNREMEEIWQLVPDGTPIDIIP
jgi:murein L,D-transpeptidase YafK